MRRRGRKSRDKCGSIHDEAPGEAAEQWQQVSARRPAWLAHLFTGLEMKLTPAFSSVCQAGIKVIDACRDRC